MQAVIVRDSVTRDDVETARDALGWQLANVVSADALRPFQLMYVTPDARTLVHYVDDPRLGAKYVLVRGADDEATARAVREHLPSYAVDEIRRLVEARDAAERVRGWRYAQIAVPPAAVDDWLEPLRGALAHAEPSVRAAALTVVARWSVSTVRESVRKIARGDRDRAIRQRAEEVLARWGSA